MLSIKTARRVVVCTTGVIFHRHGTAAANLQNTDIGARCTGFEP